MTEPETEPTSEDTVTRATGMLGAPEVLFRASPSRQRAKFLAAMGMLVFGLVANGLWFGVGPGRPDHFLVHFLLVPPAIGIGLLWHMWRHRGLRVLIYPAGLLRLQGGEAESFPWDEIAIRFKFMSSEFEPHIERDGNGDITEVWFDTTTPTFQVWNVWLEIIRADGVTARVTGALADFPQLAEIVQRRTFPPLWAAAKAKLAEGEAVTFGDTLSVTAEAVTSGKYTVKWAESKPITLKGQHYIVKRQGAWSAILRDHSQIQNYHVLLALTAELGVLEASDS